MYLLLVAGIAAVTAFSLLVNLPLYLFVLSTVVRNRKRAPFNSPFFTIFTALGCVDLWWVVKSFLSI